MRAEGSVRMCSHRKRAKLGRVQGGVVGVGVGGVVVTAGVCSVPVPICEAGFALVVDVGVG